MVIRLNIKTRSTHPTGFLEQYVCWAMFPDIAIERAPVQKLKIQDDMLATWKKMFSNAVGDEKYP